MACDRAFMRIGTDRTGELHSRGLRPGRVTRPAPAIVPAGLRHAVPEGATVALCGYEPAHVFDGTTWPGIGSSRDVCPDCREAARS
jgi:hypothetical protein